MRVSILNTIESNITAPIVGDTEGPPGFNVNDQSFIRGALDRQDAAPNASSFTASGGVIVSTGALGGTNAADFNTPTVSSGLVSLTPSADGLPNGPYSLTLTLYDGPGQTGNSDTITITVTTEADTYYVETSDEAAAVASDLATRSYGQTVKLLDNVTDTDGVYTGYWKPTTAPLGTWSPTNYLTITAAAGSSPVIGEFTVDNSDDVFPGYRFTNLTFHRPWDGLDGDPSPDIVNSEDKSLLMKIDNCELFSVVGFSRKDGTFISPTTDIYSMIRLRNNGDDMIIEDNYLHDCGIPIRARGNNIEIRGNAIDNIISDAIVIGGSNIVVEDNVIANLYPFDPDTYHPDGIQFDGGAEGQSNVTIQRNRIYGQGDVSYTQGIFCSNSGGNDFDNFNIIGNRVVTGATNAILLTAATNSQIIGNSVIEDTINTSGFNPKIYVGGTGTKVLFNMTEDIDDQGTDSIIAYNTQVDYDLIDYSEYFVNPVPANAIDGLSPGANFDIVNGSPPDLEDPKHAATQYYFDYATRTTDTTDYDAWEAIVPVLSNPVDNSVGSDSFNGSADTTKLTGLLYYVVTQSSTQPTATQIKAGEDDLGNPADASGSPIVTAVGTRNISGTGLAASTTYYIHYVQEDDYGNTSNIVSGDGFTTDAAFTPTYVTFGTGDYTDRTAALTGLVDSTQFILYINFIPDTIGVDTEYLAYLPGGLNYYIYLRIFSSGRLQCRIGNNGSTSIMVSSTNMVAGEKHNIIITCDTNDAAKMWVDSESIVGSVQVDNPLGGGGNLDLVGTDWHIGTSDGAGSSQFLGQIGSYYFKGGDIIDVTDPTERDLFYNSATQDPFSLLNAPSSPHVKFTGDATAWNAGTNEGVGGDFTMTGGVT